MSTKIQNFNLLKLNNAYLNDKYILCEKSKTTPSNFKFTESPNIGETFKPNEPSLIVIHYTATSNTKSALDILTDPIKEVSAHFVIGRDSMIYQLVPLNKIAWHAGVSKWGNVTSINKYSIGIELVNCGKLEKKENNYYSWDNKIVPASEVKKIFNNKTEEFEYFHKYKTSQLNQCKKLIKIICKNFNIKEILAHSDIAPDRKIDPGPLFPMEKFKQFIK